MSSELSPDVVVVGGGIVGTAAAAFLAGAGLRVVLVERDGLASGASGANSGVVQHPFDPVLAHLYHATVHLYRELTAEGTGFRLPHEPAGMLFVSESEAAARREAETIGGAFPAITVDVAGGADLVALEPALGPGLWACRANVGFPVAPGASTYAYATLAESRGAEIRLGRSAVLEVDGDRVSGVRVDGRLVPAAAVLAAAGPWTPELLDPTRRWAPIRPFWGAVVEVTMERPPHHALEEAGIDEAIGVPLPDGHRGSPGPTGEAATPAGLSWPDDGADFSLIPGPSAHVVGSTFLAAEPDPAAWVEPILVKAARFVPDVMDAPIRGARACARPLCIDGLPLVGRVPGLRGLYVCAGHGPWGVSTGPGSSRLVADLILGLDPVIDPALDPARFGAPRG